MRCARSSKTALERFDLLASDEEAAVRSVHLARERELARPQLRIRHPHLRKRLRDLSLTLIEERDRQREAEARHLLVRLLEIASLQCRRGQAQIALELQAVARPFLLRERLLDLRIVACDLLAQALQCWQRRAAEGAAHRIGLVRCHADQIGQRELRLRHPHRRRVARPLCVQHLGLRAHEVEPRRLAELGAQPDAVANLVQQLEIILGHPELLLPLQHLVEVAADLGEELGTECGRTGLDRPQVRFRGAPP